MTKPHLVVIMPLYNGVEFLQDAITSLYAQKGVDNIVWEAIIAVNGHPAGSDTYKRACHIVAQAKEAGGTEGLHLQLQVRVIDLYDLSKRGKAVALNEVIKKHVPMQTKWIALLDVDDTWHENKLATQLPFMNGRYDVVGTRCRYFGERMCGVVPAIPLESTINWHDFFEANPLINSSVVIRRELAWWNEDEDGVEDYGLWLRLKARRARFYNCGGVPLVNHRLHSESAFNSERGGNAKKVKWLLERYGAWMQQRRDIGKMVFG